MLIAATTRLVQVRLYESGQVVHQWLGPERDCYWLAPGVLVCGEVVFSGTITIERVELDARAQQRSKRA